MTALGIGVSTQDKTFGWESLKPAPMSTEKRECLEAKHEFHEVDRLLTQAIDAWLVTRDDVALEEIQSDWAAAEKRLKAAWARLEASYSRAVVVGKQV